MFQTCLRAVRSSARPGLRPAVPLIFLVASISTVALPSSNIYTVGASFGMSRAVGVIEFAVQRGAVSARFSQDCACPSTQPARWFHCYLLSSPAVEKFDVEGVIYPYSVIPWYEDGDAWIFGGRLRDFAIGIKESPNAIRVGAKRRSIITTGIAAPTSFAVLVGITGFTGSVYMSWRRAKARAAGQVCDLCGYDLRASPCRCPECGKMR